MVPDDVSGKLVKWAQEGGPGRFLSAASYLAIAEPKSFIAPTPGNENTAHTHKQAFTQFLRTQLYTANNTQNRYLGERERESRARLGEGEHDKN